MHVHLRAHQYINKPYWMCFCCGFVYGFSANHSVLDNKKRFQIAKADLSKKNTLEIANSRLQDKLWSHSNINRRILTQNQPFRTMEQNKTPNIRTHNYSHLIFDTGEMYTGEKTTFSTTNNRKPQMSTCRRIKLYLYLSPCRKIISSVSATPIWNLKG